MSNPVSAITAVTPKTLDPVSEPTSTKQVAPVKTDKPSTTAAQKPREPYIVTLSKTAQVHSLKQNGSSVSIIAAKLGLSQSEVDATLGIATTSSGEASAETVAALL